MKKSKARIKMDCVEKVVVTSRDVKQLIWKETHMRRDAKRRLNLIKHTARFKDFEI